MNRQEKKGATILKWNFSYGKKKSGKVGMVGIYETPISISIVYAVFVEPKPFILAQAFEITTTREAKAAVISQFVKTHALQGVDCTYILDEGEYNLNLVESPLVSAAEIPLAMRWVLRDLIHFPIEEAIIDTFEVPFLRARDNIKMIYAVSIQKQQIKRIETLVNASGLVLKFIDIPEMILKNILIKNPQKVKSCALVQLSDKGGKLILCRDDQLCLSRSFDLKLEPLGEDLEKDVKMLESLALELQRSFDYLNSVFRQNVQNMIVLTPTKIDKNIIANSLKANLGSEVVELKLSEIFKIEKPIEVHEEVNYLLAMGAILRSEGKTP